MPAKIHKFDPAKYLRDAGQRVTPQRELLLRLIEEADGHVDAEELYRRARDAGADMSLSTVYRTLGILKELNLVEQRYFARDHSREHFETRSRPEHYHFTCLSCGRIIEFQTPLMNQIRDYLQIELGVQTTHVCACFEGFCRECVANGTAISERSSDAAA